MTNREIKFRAWDGKWMNSFTIEIDGLGMLPLPPKPHPEYPFKVLMQFTGLLDRDGKEIWEGDVVRLHRYLGTPGKFEDVQGIVVYRETAFQVEFAKDWAWCELHRASEVIGNIYENSELITTP